MYEIFKNQEGNFAFRLKDQNGTTLLTSDGYTQKTNCLKGVGSVKRNSKNEDRFEIKLNLSKDYYLIIKSGNGREVAHSELLKTYTAIAKGVRNVIMAIASTAEIRDLTKIKK